MPVPAGSSGIATKAAKRVLSRDSSSRSSCVIAPPEMTGTGGSESRSKHTPRRLRNHPIDLEHLGILAVYVDSVRARDVPDVLGIGVAPVPLRRVLRQRRDLAFDVRLIQRDVRLIGDVEVFPRDLVS